MKTTEKSIYHFKFSSERALRIIEKFPFLPNNSLIFEVIVN